MTERMKLRKFVIPEFVFGNGSRNLVARYARNYAARKVFIVTDPGVLEAGWADEVIRNLQESGLPHVVFSDVSPNPRDHQVMAGADLYLAEGCNLLVAVGGGSPMDCAKGIGIVSTSRKHILEFEGVDEVPEAMPPLICVPTTAGTSADISQFAIITDVEQKVKIAIVSKMVVPDVALVDPETTCTMPPLLTTATGLDALCHAVEAYVSTANSPVTDVHAIEAIRIISRNLKRAVEHPDDMEARNAMMLASLQAGMAFSNASLGAVHAMAHSIGGLMDFSHGECNGILLPFVIDYNFDAAPERYRTIAEAFGMNVAKMPDDEVHTALVAHVNAFCRDVGMETTLSDMGIGASDLPELARKAANDACIATNPKNASVEDLEKIYAQALG